MSDHTNVPAPAAEQHMPIRILSAKAYAEEQQDPTKRYGLRKEALQRKLDCKASALERITTDPRFPRAIRLPGSTRPVWLEDEIDAFLLAHREG